MLYINNFNYLMFRITQTKRHIRDKLETFLLKYNAPTYIGAIKQLVIPQRIGHKEFIRI